MKFNSKLPAPPRCSRGPTRGGRRRAIPLRHGLPQRAYSNLLLSLWTGGMDLSDQDRGMPPGRRGRRRGTFSAVHDKLWRAAPQAVFAAQGGHFRRQQHAAFCHYPAGCLLPIAWCGCWISPGWADQRPASFTGLIQPQAEAGAVFPDPLPWLERVYLLLLGAVSRWDNGN